MALLALAPAASGQDAESLFKEGRAALARGDFDGGCPKFVESAKLTKRASTLLSLAECDEHFGKLLDAAQRWREGIAMLDPSDDRLAPSKDRLAALEKKIPAMTIKLAAGLPAGARLTADGKEVALSSVRTPIQVDPGTHVVVLAVPKHQDRSVSVTLGAGESKEVELSPGPAIASTVAPAPPPSEGGGSTRRTLGFVIGGVGVAGIGLGAVTGIMTIGKKGTMEDNCVAGCNDAARDAADAGKTFSTISTIGFAAGAALTAAGVVLVITSGRGDDQPKATMTSSALPGGAALIATGSF